MINVDELYTKVEQIPGDDGWCHQNGCDQTVKIVFKMVYKGFTVDEAIEIASQLYNITLDEQSKG